MQAAPRPKIENRYYQRTAGTAMACWVCYKETTTVLATLDKADFLYVCPSHLTDRNFASSLTPPTPIVSGAAGEPTKEQIAAVVAEYEAKKSKNKAESSENKDKDKSEKGKGGADVASAYLTPTASSSAPAGPTHNVYALHRDFYAMRLAELRKRENLSKAKAVSKGDGGGTL